MPKWFAREVPTIGVAGISVAGSFFAAGAEAFFAAARAPVGKRASGKTTAVRVRAGAGAFFAGASGFLAGSVGLSFGVVGALSS
jgi:hypothetical protein